MSARRVCDLASAGEFSYDRFPTENPGGSFGLWMAATIAVDSVCLVIDISDVGRFVAGDRLPIVS